MHLRYLHHASSVASTAGSRLCCRVRLGSNWHGAFLSMHLLLDPGRDSGIQMRPSELHLRIFRLRYFSAMRKMDFTSSTKWQATRPFWKRFQALQRWKPRCRGLGRPVTFHFPQILGILAPEGWMETWKPSMSLTTSSMQECYWMATHLTHLETLGKMCSWSIEQNLVRFPILRRMNHVYQKGGQPATTRAWEMDSSAQRGNPTQLIRAIWCHVLRWCLMWYGFKTLQNTFLKLHSWFMVVPFSTFSFIGQVFPFFIFFID